MLSTLKSNLSSDERSNFTEGANSLGLLINAVFKPHAWAASRSSLCAAHSMTSSGSRSNNLADPRYVSGIRFVMTEKLSADNAIPR